MSRNDPKYFFCAPFTSTLPFAAAARAIQVPASILSGKTLCSVPPSLGTPVIVTVGDPAPSMIAPMPVSILHMSATSGSHAAFSITVVPGASTAAMMMLAVPVTVLPKRPPRYICAPRILRASTQMKPLSISTLQPSARSPLMCRSTGLAPMTQPPGSDTSALRSLAVSGPSRQMLARIFLTSS